MPIRTTIWPHVGDVASSDGVRIGSPEQVMRRTLCLRIRALSSFNN
jgi:hypothetical protein